VGKCLSFRKFQIIFVYSGPHLVAITPASLGQPAQQRAKMVGESWDVFTKQVFVEKHISSIMCEQ